MKKMPARVASLCPKKCLMASLLSLAAFSASATDFYADPQSPAARWVHDNPTDPRAASIKVSIADHPAARWFGDFSGDIGSAVASYVGKATSAGQVPILVAYNIPNRDCGQASAGGAASYGAYRQWIATFAAGIGSREAVVILEPDALAGMTCLSAAQQAERVDMLSYATLQFAAKAPSAKVYLDIGHTGWLGRDKAVELLQQAGVANIRGFSLNVSNFRWQAEENTYGMSIVEGLAKAGLSKKFVIDTSRSGMGPAGTAWCDPAGRRLGTPSRVNSSMSPNEMVLWVKNPGASDGCAAAAGTFDPDLAIRLIQGG